MPRDYLSLARKYGLDEVVDRRRAQELVNGKNFKSPEPHTDTKVTDPSEHWYDIVDVHCLFGGVVQIRIFSSSNLVAPL